MFNPEAIEAALFALIVEATKNFGFRKYSRRYDLWSNTGVEQQDALYLVPKGAVVDESQAYGAPRYQLKYYIGVYSFTTDDRNAVPQTRLNQAWAAIDAALRAKPPGEKQTLGGLVENCWIDGQVEIAPWGQNQQLELAIPVTAITGI